MKTQKDKILNEISRTGYYEVIGGTLRSQDLLPEFFNLAKIMSTFARNDIPVGVMNDPAHAWWNSDECQFVIEELTDVLNENAPEGYYFGSNEGDGSVFGYWPCD